MKMFIYVHNSDLPFPEIPSVLEIPSSPLFLFSFTSLHVYIYYVVQRVPRHTNEKVGKIDKDAANL